MKRLVLAFAIGYLILALAARAKEAAGLLTCECTRTAGARSRA
jgi:hypothetical protein